MTGRDSSLTALAEEPLAPDEFQRRLAQALAELDGEEGEQIGELIAWFLRRYPTPEARLRYTRRKLREWGLIE